MRKPLKKKYDLSEMNAAWDSKYGGKSNTGASKSGKQELVGAFTLK